MTLPKLLPLIYAAILVIIGYVLAQIAKRVVSRLIRRVATPQQHMLVTRTVKYAIWLIFIIAAFQQVGFRLSVLLGTAGIVTLAISFAAQTAVANIISGIFIILERPFTLGDIITVNDVTGEVVAIDLLSVKLRTASNTLVRVPNDVLLKTAIHNQTFYHHRRLELHFALADGNDLNKAREVLTHEISQQPNVLTDPPVQVWMQNFSSGNYNIDLHAWCDRAHYAILKNSLPEQLSIALNQAKIDLAKSAFDIVPR